MDRGTLEERPPAGLQDSQLCVCPSGQHKVEKNFPCALVFFLCLFAASLRTASQTCRSRPTVATSTPLSQKPEESHSPRLCDARPVSGAGCALCLSVFSCVAPICISAGDDCSIYLFMKKPRPQYTHPPRPIHNDASSLPTPPTFLSPPCSHTRPFSSPAASCRAARAGPVCARGSSGAAARAARS